MWASKSFDTMLMQQREAAEVVLQQECKQLKIIFVEAPALRYWGFAMLMSQRYIFGTFKMIIYVGAQP